MTVCELKSLLRVFLPDNCRTCPFFDCFLHWNRASTSGLPFRVFITQRTGFLLLLHSFLLWAEQLTVKFEECIGMQIWLQFSREWHHKRLIWIQFCFTFRCQVCSIRTWSIWKLITDSHHSSHLTKFRGNITGDTAKRQRRIKTCIHWSTYERRQFIVFLLASEIPHSFSLQFSHLRE